MDNFDLDNKNDLNNENIAPDTQHTEPVEVAVDNMPSVQPVTPGATTSAAPAAQPEVQPAESGNTIPAAPSAPQVSDTPFAPPAPQYVPQEQQYTQPVQQYAPQQYVHKDMPAQQYVPQQSQQSQQYIHKDMPTGGGIPKAGPQQSQQSYYTENIKKTKTRKIGIGQLILVAVLSSVLGGGVVFAGMTFLAPVIQPAINDMFGITAQASNVAVSGDNGIYKKVEITQSSTPVEAISEKVSPSIVGIQVTVKAQGSGFFFDIAQDGVGEGSGIIIREDGYILTNNHVIESALISNSNKLSEGSKIEVVLPNDTEKKYTAQIVGRDSKTDIAVLKIEGKNLPAAELGDSDKVKSGELAVAIGNPGGIDYMGSVTSGIISGINRTIQMDNGQTLKLLQTDAAINPGNSGGALVNSQGQVIGVNTVKIAASGYEGLGFAIPINEANEIATSLIEYKYVKGRPQLGVSIDQTFTEQDAKRFNVPYGPLVYEVMPFSAAYKAGIHASDIITKIDGKTVTTFSELEAEKNTHKPGDSIEIEVYRSGETLTLTVVLDEENNSD